MLSHLKNFWQQFTGVEKRLLLLFVLLLLIGGVLQIVFSRSGKQIPDMGGAYAEGLVGQPKYINPLLAPANDVDADLARVIYGGLLKFDSRLNLAPDLAETLPEISPDGKEYTVTLRQNLSWHDGVELTADDVVFTFHTIQNAEVQSPLRLSWNRVTIEKIDSRKIKIITRESSATFISNLTVGIIPKHIWESVPASSFALSKFNLEPIGSGPYQISNLKRNRDGAIREISLSAAKNYHREGPYISSLVFKFYNSTDEIIDAYQARDIMGLGYVPFDRSLFIEPGKKLQQFLLPLPQYQAVFINRLKNPAPLEDTRVRLAMAKSVNKKKIIDEVFGGKVFEAYGPILPGHLGYHEQIPGAEMNMYDVQHARTLLDQAGWIARDESGKRKDKQGRTLALSLATNNFPPNVKVAENLKSMWEEIGLEITLHIETIRDLEEQYIRPRNYELLLFSENVGNDPDPFPFWHSSQLRDPGLNLSNFTNREADRLLVEARANIPAADRATKYKKFQETFVGDVPAIFLSRSVFVYNVSSEIQSVNLEVVTTPADRFADINQWYIETKRVRR